MSAFSGANLRSISRSASVRLPLRVELLLAQLADRHAGHAHVGLEPELRRLGEADLDAVALRLERDRAAEGQPQEQQQPEAREREDDHHHDAREGGCGGLHQPLPRFFLPTGRSGSSGSSGSVAAAVAAVAGLRVRQQRRQHRGELELGLRLQHLLQRRARRGDRDRAERAVGVGAREQLGGGVVQPGQPEQVALLAGGVVGALACRSGCSRAG